MLSLIHKHIIPAAFSLLPAKMNSSEAIQMMLTIGLQESGFTHRRQEKGPARGFWQFEITGAAEVMRHPSTAEYAKDVLNELQYGFLPPAGVLSLLEDNDVLAACWARLALWRHPDPLTDIASDMWFIYDEIWRPGKPRPDAWQGNWDRALS